MYLIAASIDEITVYYIYASLHKTYVDCYIWWQNHEGFKNLPFAVVHALGVVPYIVDLPLKFLSGECVNVRSIWVSTLRRGRLLEREAEHWQPDVPSKYVVHGTNNLKHSDFISKNDYYNKIKKFDILTKWIFFLHKNVISSNILASFPGVAKA